ncbi:glycosyltransferase family 4 protein [Falsirhodobacter algicola]|uniref:Glycosyltransferase n=1 Tax=Falsirhodobacter algicola TaxID=2692330 RepID=A0A8J8SKY4_9RHOB|nr:glycosyltransferase family 4 protein [Falsirhodobacter algicola]QUS35967.1 glycosyltransferase [Falsirhodobacter algicola]
MIEVIAPNLKRRLSGVTATIARLVPIQAREIGIRATGPGLPQGVPHMPLWRVALLPRDRWRVWHARRNTEMLLGLVLRHVLRRRLRLLFTSASQRRHTGWSRWLIGRMDAVVATSAKGAAYLEREAEVILHGIDTHAFRPAADRAALRARLNLPETGPLIGCYGRIRASKGTDNFVAAMIALLPEREGHAVVMGRALDKDRAFLDDLKARIAAAGLTERILFRPEVTVDRMPDWYAALDLYVAPQRWEGFGLTPLEAMACGVPVVATRTGAFEELLGPTGRLVPTDDVPALTAGIAAMLDAPDAAGRAAAVRRRVEDGFRIEDEARALNALYRRMLA